MVVTPRGPVVIVPSPSIILTPVYGLYARPKRDDVVNAVLSQSGSSMVIDRPVAPDTAVLDLIR